VLLKILLLIAIYFSPFVLLSQVLPGGQYDKHEVSNPDVTPSSAFTAINFKSQKIFNDYSFEGGIESGVFVNDKFSVGFCFYSDLGRNVTIPLDTSGIYKGIMTLMYAGISGDYYLKLSKKFYLNLGLMGGVGLIDHSGMIVSEFNQPVSSEFFIISEIQTGIMYRISQKLFANISINYRLAPWLDYPSYNKGTLNSPLICIGISTILFNI